MKDFRKSVLTKNGESGQAILFLVIILTAFTALLISAILVFQIHDTKAGRVSRERSYIRKLENSVTLFYKENARYIDQYNNNGQFTIPSDSGGVTITPSSQNINSLIAPFLNIELRYNVQVYVSTIQKNQSDSQPTFYHIFYLAIPSQNYGNGTFNPNPPAGQPFFVPAVKTQIYGVVTGEPIESQLYTASLDQIELISANMQNYFYSKMYGQGYGMHNSGLDYYAANDCSKFKDPDLVSQNLECTNDQYEPLESVILQNSPASFYGIFNIYVDSKGSETNNKPQLLNAWGLPILINNSSQASLSGPPYSALLASPTPWGYYLNKCAGTSDPNALQYSCIDQIVNQPS